MTSCEDFWAAAQVLAVDPAIGVCLRGPPGAVRDAFLGVMRVEPWVRVPAGVTDDRLLGGVDLAGTLAAGRPVMERGLLAAAAGGVVVLAMAERAGSGVAGRIGTAMDGSGRFGVVALDEGVGEERAPAGLLDRLGVWLDLSEVFRVEGTAGSADLVGARGRLGSVVMGEAALEALVGGAARLGVGSMRAPLLALRVARASAALAGRGEVDEADLGLAARLVLGPRATVLPSVEEEGGEAEAEPEKGEPERSGEDAPEGEREGDGEMAEVVLAAAMAAMPAGLLAQLATGGALRARTGGVAGAMRKAAQRGRPVGVRRGEPRGGARLALLDTLRAAAPWQGVRGRSGARVEVRRDDFRVRRFAQPTRTTTIFVVDASGSAALARLAEAKGAVELLLAECYVRRDRVALLSVRGRSAELLLPPTSSLARAKRSLAGLPGGGGTPLAAGFEAAGVLADQVRRGGQTPLAVFLTDGRANVDRRGAPGRPGAEADALAAARGVRALGVSCLLVDTSRFANPFAQALAAACGARYLALPSADAGMLRAAVALAQKG